jgi:hypothetical protein
MKNGFMFTKGYKKLAIASVIVAAAASAHAQASSGPVAKSPYTVTVFAAAPQGLTNPDSITTANGNIYVVYANNTQPDGTGGSSTIVEYGPSGKMLRTFSVLGKSDGLKYDPYTHKLWALRDEDSDPALTLIDPKSGAQTDYIMHRSRLMAAVTMTLFSLRAKPSSAPRTQFSNRPLQQRQTAKILILRSSKPG